VRLNVASSPAGRRGFASGIFLFEIVYLVFGLALIYSIYYITVYTNIIYNIYSFWAIVPRGLRGLSLNVSVLVAGTIFSGRSKSRSIYQRGNEKVKGRSKHTQTLSAPNLLQNWSHICE